nr:hypothetical protein [Mycobacterium tuberculosis]
MVLVARQYRPLACHQQRRRQNITIETYKQILNNKDKTEENKKMRQKGK